MPLPLTVSCSIKIQIGFTFLVPAHPGCPGQRAVKRVCVCVCVVYVCETLIFLLSGFFSTSYGSGNSRVSIAKKPRKFTRWTAYETTTVNAHFKLWIQGTRAGLPGICRVFVWMIMPLSKCIVNKSKL